MDNLSVFHVMLEWLHSNKYTVVTRRAFSRAHTSPINLDLPKFNHLVPCGQGYDRQRLVTIGLKLAPGSYSQTCIYLYIYIYIYQPTYWRQRKLPSPSVGEVIKYEHCVTKVINSPTSTGKMYSYVNLAPFLMSQWRRPGVSNSAGIVGLNWNKLPFGRPH